MDDSKPLVLNRHTNDTMDSHSVPSSTPESSVVLTPPLPPTKKTPSARCNGRSARTSCQPTYKALITLQSYMNIYTNWLTHLPPLTHTFLHLYSLSFICTHFPSFLLTSLHLYSLTFTLVPYMWASMTFLLYMWATITFWPAEERDSAWRGVDARACFTSLEEKGGGGEGRERKEEILVVESSAIIM